MHGSHAIHKHVRGVIESRQSICNHLVTLRRRAACLFLGPHMDSFTGVPRLVRANHGPCFAARRIPQYHPVPKSPTVTLDLPATHHPHSAAVGPFPKHTLLRTQMDYAVHTMETILQKSGGVACPVFSHGPWHSGLDLPVCRSGPVCSYLGPLQLCCWRPCRPGLPSLLGRLRKREAENPHKSTSTSRSPPSTSLCDPPGRQGRYQISHMQRITGRREGVTIDDGAQRRWLFAGLIGSEL